MRSRELTVFLSSTWADLEGHRKAATFALAGLKQRVQGMEFFPAKPGAPLEECLLAVRRAQVVVLVVGTRYGSLTSSGESFTESEYQEAYRLGKRLLVFLIDEQSHPVLPKYVDIGESAVRLRRFKEALQERHLCAFFHSPDHLAHEITKAVVALLEEEDSEFKRRTALAYLEELPRLLVDGGYSLGLMRDQLDLSGVIQADPDGNLSLADPIIRSAMVGAFVVRGLLQGNYEVLKGILTFDRETWDIIIHLSRYYRLDDRSLASAIEQSGNRMKARLLIGLAGGLGSDRCAKAVCQKLFQPLGFKGDFRYLEGVTPFNDVVLSALQSMSPGVIPVVESALERARREKRWREKRLLERVLQSQKRQESVHAGTEPN